MSADIPLGRAHYEAQVYCANRFAEAARDAANDVAALERQARFVALTPKQSETLRVRRRQADEFGRMAHHLRETALVLFAHMEIEHVPGLERAA